MFNLKNIKEEFLNKENLLKYINEYDIYNYYLPNIEIGRITHSPFREDNNPSFGIFIKNGQLLFNDYKVGGGDVIKFVSLMEKVDYFTAQSIINKIFDIGLIDFNSKITKEYYKPVITNFKVPKRKKKIKISIKTRKWNKDDLDYFEPLNISLMKHIYPIKYFWVDEQLFNTSKLAYAYKYDTNVYKIYQPLLTTATGKWWSNISNKVEWYGHKELSRKGDILFVASSNKDAIVLQQCGFNAIAPHTESQMFSVKQFEHYNRRFDKIIIFYDNDETGLLKAEKFCEAYNLTYLVLEEKNTKDPFEFIKKYDLNELKEWIEQWI